MAVMDTVEMVGSNTKADPDKEQPTQVKPSPAQPKVPGLALPSAPRPPSSLPQLPPVSKTQDRFATGPSPMKGSGQDRFRQMMTGTPKPPDFTSILPAPAPFHFPMDVEDMAYYGPHYPVFHQDMYGEPDPRHRMVINTTMYPPARPTATAATDMAGGSQSSLKLEEPVPMPMTHGGSGYGIASTRTTSGNGNSNSQSGHSRDAAGPTITWTSVLSAECQKRRFNPQFTEWITPDGHYRASVNLQGLIMHDSRNYKNAADAKQSLAKRAVEHVRKLEVPPGHSNKAAERARFGHEVMMNRDRGLNRKPPVNKETGDSKPEARSGAAGGGSAVQNRREEDRRLVERIKNLYGRSVGPSESILADPVASRAFLEGFALGGKLRESSTRRQDVEQRRSRSPSNDRRGNDKQSSPINSGNRVYRERSLPRRGPFEGY